MFAYYLFLLVVQVISKNRNPSIFMIFTVKQEYSKINCQTEPLSERYILLRERLGIADWRSGGKFVLIRNP